MLSEWASTLIAVVLVSALSLSGGLVLLVSPALISGSLLALVSFAAGALLGDVFLHLLPEMVETGPSLELWESFTLLGGILMFFTLEKVLHWHHAHLPDEQVLHPLAVTNLVGDGLHNFVDGALIAGAFLTSTPLGIATAIAVALHEIPQELGDFSILVHAGLAPKRALALNLLTGLAAVVGAVATLLLASSVERLAEVLVPLTAGGFIYIASTDLLPELHREPEASKSVVQVLGLLSGVGVMWALLLLE